MAAIWRPWKDGWLGEPGARAKRTFVCGLHESLKHLKADNVKCIIVARNYDVELFEGVSLFHRLRIECFNRNVPIVHASKKRCLSRVLKKFPYTNVIALFRFDAFEELYREVIRMWHESDSHIQYHIDQASLFA
uniref:Ribosomal_L7Ae domain-containing protein n=1 Tax=Angiostrongylus cantonensis TaxID=6313 RepID=A0A0K0DKE7_ANGCA